MSWLIAIILISIALVFLFSVNLYARCIIRRELRRGAAIHDLSLLVTSYSAVDILPGNTGLDATVIASLPVFVFKQEKTESQNEGDQNSSVIECCVCLNNLEDEETARLLPNCKHVFHVACIDTWLASQPTCPICRTIAQPLIEPLPREGPI